jgi:hypothetical protein
MFQRIQSVFLLLTDVLLVLLFFVPFGTVGIAAAATSVAALDLIWPLVAQFVLSSVAVIAAVNYKNRKLQMRLCLIGATVSVMYLAFVYTLINFVMGETMSFSPGIGAHFSALNPALFVLAYYFIKRDEEMVRSADRLR